MGNNIIIMEVKATTTRGRRIITRRGFIILRDLHAIQSARPAQNPQSSQMNSNGINPIRALSRRVVSLLFNIFVLI